MSAITNVKCVVIGDGAVGKSCFLITATTNAFPAEYVPTVFDNYAHNVQLRDGRQASVSFWDTAGQEDYDRLRPLSYPQTDTFLVCFSVNSHTSFENVRHKWVPEITHYCPHTPWLLVGMKSDLRTSSQQHQVQSSHHRMVEKDEAVQLAKDLGAISYYECSSLEGTGLNDIVQAAVSTALNHSTKPTRKTFNWPWKRHGKSNPKAEEPSIPLPPELPVNTKAPWINIPSSTLQSEWLKTVNNEHLSDVQFHYKTNCYYGHKVVLCAASELFWRIFDIGRELKGEESLSQCNTWSKKRLNAINRQCINNGAVGAFRNIYDKDDITVITVNDEQVTKLSFERCLSFLYTGCADVKNDDDLDDTIAAAELLNLPELIMVCNNIKSDEEFLNPSVGTWLNDRNSEVMRKLFLNKTLYSDITFVVNGQKIPAHRCVLTTRCEVMSAMFSGQFAESKTAEVEIPAVDLNTFMAFLQYLYTDHCPIEDGEATMILVLANQYCTNRLKALCELYISKSVEKATEVSIANSELSVIDLLLNTQLHNGEQLSSFLLHFVSSNYLAFEKMEEFQKLTGENLSYVNEHRWPPLSYINEMEEWKEKYGEESSHSTMKSSVNNNCVVM